MSFSKRIEEELHREDLEFEPRYGEEVETWPTEAEMQGDAQNEQ